MDFEHAKAVERETLTRIQVNRQNEADAATAAEAAVQKQELDDQVCNQIAEKAGLDPKDPEVMKLRSYLNRCTTREHRQAVDVFRVSGSDDIEYDDETGAALESPKGFSSGEYQIVYGNGSDPEDYVDRISLDDLYETHLAQFDAVRGRSLEENRSSLLKPLDLDAPEGQARGADLLTDALEGTTLGADAEVRKTLLNAVKDARALDEIEIHEVMSRAPGHTEMDPSDLSSFRLRTIVSYWPADPGISRAKEGEPLSGPALIRQTRTLRSVVAELDSRQRVRLLHGKHAEALLRPRRPTFY